MTPEPEKKTPHILILDDDTAHQELCLRAFRDDPELVRVSVAGSVREAARIIETDPVDLIVADWLLPDGRGLEVLPRSNGLVTVPLIIMTSHGDEQLAVEIMKSGAIDYVVKSATMFRELPHIARRAIRDWTNIRIRREAEEAAREAQKRVADIIAFLPDAVFAIDTGGRVIAWNHAIERMTGVPAADMLGRGDHAYSIPFYGERRPILIDLTFLADAEIEKKYDYILREGDRITSETFIPAMYGGKGAYLWGTATRLYDLQGNVTGAIEVIRDITDRKQNEMNLLKSEERYRSLLENLNEGIWVIDQDGVTTFANLQMAQMLGYSVEEMTGRPLFAFMDDDGKSVAVTLMERRRQGITEQHDFEFVKKDGSRIITVVNTSPMFDELGNFTGALAGVTDITRQRVVEKTLMASENRFRELFDNMGAGVAVYAVTGNGDEFVFRDINRAVERIEHVRREDVIGRNVREVFPGVEEFGLLDVFRRVSRSGIAESHPVTQYRDDRIAGWRENYVYKLPSGEIVAIYEDVTDKKQAEEAAAEAREWLGMALRAAKAGTWDWDMATGTLTWSPEFYELFGIPPGTPATFESWLAALHPDDRTPAMARIDQSVKDHTYLWNEYRIVLPDGTIRWIGAGGTTVYSPEDKPVRMSGVCIDISALKQAEERLRAQGQILDQMYEGVCMVRARDNTIVYTNPRFNIMFGYAPGELDGREIAIINAPVEGRTPGDVAEAIRAQLVEKGVWSGEVQNIRKDGTTVHCQASVSAFVHPQFGQVWIAVHEDITKRKQAEEALQQSEVRYRTLTETVPDIIARFDRDHRHIFINAAIGKITGHPPEFYYGKTNRDIGMPEELVAHWDEKLDQVFSSGQPTTLEFVYSFAGEDRFFESRLVPEFSPEGQVISVISIARDVTDHRHAQAALEKNRIQLDDAMDLAHIVYWELDVLSAIFTFNDRFYDLYATTADREGGYTMAAQEYATRFIPPEEQELVAQETQKAVETADSDYVAQIEHRIIRRDGKIRTIVVRYSVVKDAAGRTVKTYGANQDITDRKAMEQALLDSEERLRLALEGADIASWDWDLKTGKAIFSDRFYTILEYRPGDFPATHESLVGLMHPDDRQNILPMVQKQIDEKQPFIEAEYRLLSRDGAWLWFLSRGRIVDYDENGVPRRLTGVNIDITNRRLMESEIRSLNTVLEQRVKDRTEALSRANEALEEENAQRLEAETKLKASVEEKSMLLKEIHHRVKNNLQIIASLLNLQSRYIRDEQTLAAIRESQNRVKAMALVHEKLYRAEDISHISLEDYVKFLANGLFQFYDAKSRGIRFQLDIQAVSVDINTAIPLGLIINELISNSLKYAFPEGRKGTVSVTVRQEGLNLTVIYADDGIGIPAELDWKNTQSLGLRLVNTLVDQMDGTVELDRAGGTRFTMLLHSKA